MAFWMSVIAQWWAKDIRLDLPIVMFDDFLHQLVSGSLPSQSWRFNVGEHRKPWERCRTESTRDETHGTVQLHIDLTCGVTTLGRSTLLLNSKVPEQMTAGCWRWCPDGPASFINKLFLFFSLPAVFVKCSL